MGINVGDWLAPIRLLAPPSTPLYGVEGSPATAAIATANLKTSDQYASSSCSKLLPFSLAAPRQIEQIHSEGGVCFSSVPTRSSVRGRVHIVNIGGRFVNPNAKMNQCPKASDVAGATTLDHALRQALCPTTYGPRIYILKMDIEGFEFRAISSILSNWLSTTPPCYFFVEIWRQPNYVAVIESLLTIVGYDAVWRPRNLEFPGSTSPWLTGLTGATNEVDQIFADSKQDYFELIFGFDDVDKCINNLLS